MERDLLRELRDRVEERVSAWRITIERRTETESSILVFGRRGPRPVVLKVVRRGCDEWKSGQVLRAFEGRGVVRLYDAVDGAVLLELLVPGHSLARLTHGGADEEATPILAGVIRTMSRAEWMVRCRRCSSGARDSRVAPPVETLASRTASFRKRTTCTRSCVHLRQRRGCCTANLHHYNVLFDTRRGWVVVNPKGMLGEVEYEIGAALRNPYDHPELFTGPAIILKRLDCIAGELGLDASTSIRQRCRP